MSRYFPHTFNVSYSEVRYSLLLYYVLLLIFILTEHTTEHGSASGSLGICWTTAVPDADRKFIRAFWPHSQSSFQNCLLCFSLLFCFHILCVRWNDCRSSKFPCLWAHIPQETSLYLAYVLVLWAVQIKWHVLSPVPSTYGWLKTITTGHIKRGNLPM